MRCRLYTLSSATVPVRVDSPDAGAISDGIAGTEFGLQNGSGDIIYAGSSAECVQNQAAGSVTVNTLPTGKSASFVMWPGEACWALPKSGAGPVTVEAVTTGVKPDA